MYNGWVGLVTLLVILPRKRHLEVVLVMRRIQRWIQSWFSVFTLIVIGGK
jgi:hypothetical protein